MNSLVLKPWRWLTGFFCAVISWRAAAAFSATAFGVICCCGRNRRGDLLAGRLRRQRQRRERGGSSGLRRQQPYAATFSAGLPAQLDGRHRFLLSSLQASWPWRPTALLQRASSRQASLPSDPAFSQRSGLRPTFLPAAAVDFAERAAGAFFLSAIGVVSLSRRVRRLAAMRVNPSATAACSLSLQADMAGSTVPWGAWPIRYFALSWSNPLDGRTVGGSEHCPNGNADALCSLLFRLCTGLLASSTRQRNINFIENEGQALGRVWAPLPGTA